VSTPVVRGRSRVSPADAIHVQALGKGPAVQTQRARCPRLDGMKKRLLITGLVLAALLLALYGVMFGTGVE
jgi:hypothetical protein